MIITPFAFMAPQGDADVQAYLNATGITDPTTVGAITTLVSDLKSAGTANGGTFWDNLIAFYPIAGTNASAQSYNLKNTTQYNITWSGGLTHNALGATGNGSTGFGDTGWIPSLDANYWSGNQSGGFGWYAQNSLSGTTMAFAAGPSGANGQARLMNFSFQGNGFLDFADKAAGVEPGRIVNPALLGTGHIINVSENNVGANTSTLRAYKNGSLVGGRVDTLSAVKANAPNTPMKLFKRDDGYYSNITISSAFISYLIDNTEVSTFDGIVNAYQTTMSRNTY